MCVSVSTFALYMFTKLDANAMPLEAAPDHYFQYSAISNNMADARICDVGNDTAATDFKVLV
jgi:hypothetical protein